MAYKKKISARRKQVRDNIASKRFDRLSEFLNSGIPISIVILLIFAFFASVIIVFNPSDNGLFRPIPDIAAIGGIVLLISFAAGFYTYHYERRVIKNHLRAIALSVLYLILLAASKIGSFFPEWLYLATGSAITSAIILTIAYNQRYALAMSLFYATLSCLAASSYANMEMYLTMMSGIVICSFSIKEIRTRMKLIEVGLIAGLAVFTMAVAVGFVELSNEKSMFESGIIAIQSRSMGSIFSDAIKAAFVTFVVGLLIQALLPVIEKSFRIATSMTLLDYSDANQPLLKRLAMEAPGTYSHSLLIGSISETAAESIGSNGLLCRVGSYYHDIGKINKPRYFVENQMGMPSSHNQLSPTMSQLVIAGHVKDGIEMAKEYGLPTILRQFIETHHGTTLIEYFYELAKKRAGQDQPPPSESEFRYPGPRPLTKEAAIVMLADAVEGAVRSLTGEVTPTRIETVVHNIAMKRLQDGQFDECEMTLKELSLIETSLSKSLSGHYHGRIAYPKAPDEPLKDIKEEKQNAQQN